MQENDKLQTFAEFGKIQRKLWKTDYGTGMNGAVQKVLEHGIKVKSSINQDLSGLNTVRIPGNKFWGGGKLGLDIKDSKPSMYAWWRVPWGDSLSVRNRFHKPYWSSNIVPGADWKYQNPNLSFTTSYGGDVNNRMDNINKPDSDNMVVAHSLAVGDGPFSIGGEIKYDFDNDDKRPTLTDFNMGVDWKRQDYGLGFRTKDKLRHLTASMWGDLHPGIRVGSAQSYDTRDGTAKTGVVISVGDDKIMRAKLNADTSGDVGCSAVFRMYEPSVTNDLKVKTHINALTNWYTPEKERFGFGISFGDV